MNTRKSAVKWAGASALAVLLASTSAFAAPQHNRDRYGKDSQAGQTQVQQPQEQANRGGAYGRGQQAPVAHQQQAPVAHQQQAPVAQSWGNGNASRGHDQSNTYRENQRVNVSGRVKSFSRERDGYRVYLDNGNYWIPASRFGNRARDLRVGVSLSLGGIFRGGVFGIDAVSWPVSAGYGNDQAYVRGVVQQVDYRSGTMTVRDASTGRLVEVTMRDVANSRLGRGDYVTLSGQWVRGNVFAAYRID